MGAAGAGLEAEIAILRLLAGRMPFATPDPRGLAVMRGGGRALVYPALRGTPVSLSAVSADRVLAEAVGRAIGAIHSLDIEALTSVGVPVYDSESLRRRCLATLDRGAEPGIVPAGLLSRWEALLEDVSMWRFHPCSVHGELVSDRVLVDGSGVSGVLDWAGARVSDPAEDLAWIAVGADSNGLDQVLTAYRAVSPPTDSHVVDRAVLHGEMALVSWLMHGLRAGDERIVADATVMLEELATWHESQAPKVTPSLPTIPPAGPTPASTGAAETARAPTPTSPPSNSAATTKPATVGGGSGQDEAATECEPIGTGTPGPDPTAVSDRTPDTISRRTAMGVTSVPRYSAARYAEADADDTDVIDLDQVKAYLAARSAGSLPAPAAAAPVDLTTGGAESADPPPDPSRTS